MSGWFSGEKPNIDMEIRKNTLKCAAEDNGVNCSKNAEFILWYPHSWTGPRCHAHALEHVGNDAIREGSGAPIYRLPRVGAVGDNSSGGLLINGQDVGMNGVPRHELDPLAQQIICALVAEQPYNKRTDSE